MSFIVDLLINLPKIPATNSADFVRRLTMAVKSTWIHPDKVHFLTKKGQMEGHPASFTSNESTPPQKPTVVSPNVSREEATVNGR